MNSEATTELIAILIPVAGALAAALIAWLGRTTNQWIKTRVDNGRLEGILRRLNDTVFHIVAELNQTQVDALKAATSKDSPGGKKISYNEAEGLKNIAIRRLRGYLGEKGLKELSDVFGFESIDRRNQYLETVIESTVKNNKGPFRTLRTESLL